MEVVVSQWHIKVEGTVYGPYTDQQMMHFAAEKRITERSLIRHAEHTKGRWDAAESVPQMRRHILDSSLKDAVVARPVQKTSSTGIQLSSELEPETESRSNAGRVPYTVDSPRRCRSAWSLVVSVLLDCLAITWLLLFFAVYLINGIPLYFFLESGTVLGGLLTQDDTRPGIQLVVFAWAFLRHIQYSAYLMLAAQLLRAVERR